MNRKTLLSTVWMIVLCLLMGGCMYPQEKRQQLDQLDQHVARVQSAVDGYHRDQKVLPYRYMEDDWKLTTRYAVDFRQLGGYVGEIPPSAFEKGGNFMYVLVNVEKKPTVRLFDLRVNDRVGRVQNEVLLHKKQKGSLPKGEPAGQGLYKVNFPALSMDPVTVPSPYSADTELELVMDEKGKVYVDYRVEAMKKWQTVEKKPETGTDLRAWLSEDALFVPAFSPPMSFKGAEPVFDFGLTRDH
ncbi:hypothetical protein [Staphylospora marina]|uniref:hypothetical protein n=1 Tax=Staphylospora marina TaxID=2490858 RepID=UPI000F5BE932|nr:hypothetical protein [Staphylospora marina]